MALTTELDSSAVPVLPTGTLKFGARGEDVKLLQNFLASSGYNVGTVDGIFGNQTANALKLYQQSAGLASDAIYGENTRNAMLSGTVYKPPTGKTPLPSPIVKPSQQVGGTVTDANSNPVPVNTTAQAQPDYYAVTSGTPQTAQQQPDYYAVTTGTPSTPVAPPSSQQLGAQAQQNAIRTEMAQSGQMGMLTPDQIANVNNFQQTAPQPPDVSTVGQSQSAYSQPDYYAVKDHAETAQNQPDYYQVLPSSASGIVPSGTVQPSRTADTTATSKKALVEGALVADVGSGSSTSEPLPVATGNYVSVGGGSVSVGSPSITADGAVSPEQQDEYNLSVATGNGLQQMADELFDKLNIMNPDWNPEEDEGYQRDAAILENKVAQMMVARGGLYSSVARAALQSSLIDLQSNYREQAYDRFLEERAFVFQQLQFVSNRLDAEFEKSMAIKNYNLAVQKEQFDQKMAVAQFNADQKYKNAQLAISRANAQTARENAQFQRDMAVAAQAQQTAYNQLKQQEATLVTSESMLKVARDEFKVSGILTPQSAAFLGVNYISSLSTYVNAANQKQKEIDYGWVDYRNKVAQFGDAETTLEAYSSILPKAPAVVAPPKVKETTTINSLGEQTYSRTVEY